MLTRRLEQDDHRVDVAEDGEQALTMLGAVDYDLVLLDILMPRLDGFGVLERLKADERMRPAPRLPLLRPLPPRGDGQGGGLPADGSGRLRPQAVRRRHPARPRHRVS